MKRGLKDLSKDEINSLFPISLVKHNPEWKHLYQNEEGRILASVGKDIVLRIEHFGSSSIPKIMSKPYIDIIIEVSSEQLFEKNLIEAFENLGYEYFMIPEREGIDAYMSFGKGYNLEGEKEQIFHIHMCPKENVMWNQLGFRDYLNANEGRAKQYEALKLKLASEFKNDRGAYVLGKTNFVNETIDIIKNSVSQ